MPSRPPRSRLERRAAIRPERGTWRVEQGRGPAYSSMMPGDAERLQIA